MSDACASPAEITEALAALTAEPAAAAVAFDLDGTLAPIAPRPEQAAVPARTRELLERIAGRFALTAIVSGRQTLTARGILGLEALTYVGNHGYELLRPGAARPEPASALAGSEQLAATFAAGLDPARLRSVGLRLEDKGAIVGLHWRGVADVEAAALTAEAIAAEAEAQGLHVHRGRMILELRPPVDIDKGVGLTAVLREAPVVAGLYAGDDRTDVDAFRGLEELRREGRLERIVRVGVLSEETPPEVAAAADLTVWGTEGMLPVLETLA